MWMFKKLRSVCELANATLPVTEHELSHPALSELVSTVNVCKPGKTPESTVFESANLRMRLSHGDSLIHKPNIHEANLPLFCTPQRQSLQLYKCFFFLKPPLYHLLCLFLLWGWLWSSTSCTLTVLHILCLPSTLSRWPRWPHGRPPDQLHCCCWPRFGASQTPLSESHWV